MLSKLIFTALVVATVILYLRYKQRRGKTPGHSPPASTHREQARSLSAQTLAYALIGLLVAVSLTVFVLDWRAGNQIVQLRVISTGGIRADYRAYKKHLKDRSFQTLAGIRVKLGDNDRLEIIEP